MSERIADPQVVCPFVAFDDDRDFRAPGPDHRHRCFAESPAAPRALAHQAAYCLSGAFAGCPTFVDWARREAAPPRADVAVRSVRGPAAPRRTAGTPVAAAEGTSEAAPSPRPDDWAAPPPWAGAAIVAGAGAAAVPGEADASGAGDLVDDGDDVQPGGQVPPAASASAAPSPLDDTPAFLAGRAARPAPSSAAAPPPSSPPARPVEPWEPDDGGVADEDAAAPARSPSEPRRTPVGYAPVGYAPVAASRSGQRSGTSRRDRADSGAPSWEQPRRSEAYPTLKSRGAGGIPRPAIYAIVVLLVGIGLFATPFLLRGLGGGGTAGPTASPSASLSPSAEPSATPVPAPTQIVYVVKKGDTLSGIAAKYKVTVDQILKANPSIKNANQIAPGDQIVIPQALPTEIVNGAITPAP